MISCDNKNCHHESSQISVNVLVELPVSATMLVGVAAIPFCIFILKYYGTNFYHIMREYARLTLVKACSA